MSRVIVIGSINQDIVVSADRHPNTGETIHGKNISYHSGGKGANQAVAAAKAGATTYIIGAVGNDEAAHHQQATLQKSGVLTDYLVVKDGQPTGTALITVAGGENSIVVVGGANQHLSIQDLGSIRFEKSDLVVAQFEVPINTIQTSFRLAKAAGATTILNPSPAAEIKSDLIKNVDYLIVNEHEFSTIFNKAYDNSKKLESIFETITPEFKGTLILTLGKSGAVLFGRSGILKQEGKKVDLVDSTGAGDCFTGYFSACLAMGQSEKAALELANSAAAISVTKEGAIASIPSRSELG